MLLKDEDIRKASLEKRKAIHASYVPNDVKKVNFVEKVEEENVEKAIENTENFVNLEGENTEKNVEKETEKSTKNVKEEIKSNKKK